MATVYAPPLDRGNIFVHRSACRDRDTLYRVDVGWCAIVSVAQSIAIVFSENRRGLRSDRCPKKTIKYTCAAIDVLLMEQSHRSSRAHLLLCPTKKSVFRNRLQVRLGRYRPTGSLFTSVRRRSNVFFTLLGFR